MSSLVIRKRRRECVSKRGDQGREIFPDGARYNVGAERAVAMDEAVSRRDGLGERDVAEKRLMLARYLVGRLADDFDTTLHGKETHFVRRKRCASPIADQLHGLLGIDAHVREKDTRRHMSHDDEIGFHEGPNRRMQTIRRDRVHPDAERRFELLVEPRQAEQRGRALELEQQVEVAVLARIAAGARPEHGDAAHAEARAQLRFEGAKAGEEGVEGGHGRKDSTQYRPIPVEGPVLPPGGEYLGKASTQDEMQCVLVP